MLRMMELAATALVAVCGWTPELAANTTRIPEGVELAHGRSRLDGQILTTQVAETELSRRQRGLSRSGHNGIDRLSRPGMTVTQSAFS
jgi:hypothetical protein